jgi:hypothetical protein
MMAAAFETRNLVLGAALLATLGASWWSFVQEDTPDDGGIASVAAKSTGARAPRAAAVRRSALPVLAHPASKADGAEVDLFKTHAWYVPPPPKPKPVVSTPLPPPKPTAPPVPFGYIGKLEDTPKGTVLFLTAGNRVHTVAVGEVIDRVWRVDGEDAGFVRLTYVPLNLPQVLSKSAKPAPRNAASVDAQNQNVIQGNPE